MKYVITGTLATALLVACGSKSTVEDHRKEEVVSTVVAGGESEKELEERLAKIRQEEEEKAKQEKANTTTMSFDRMFHDFGDVKPEVENTTTFKVTNTGDKPLIIEDVSASCGCTTPQKPTEPILPGKSDVITVSFTSKPGQLNEQNKTVAVTANTDPKVQTLKIRAFVKEK